MTDPIDQLIQAVRRLYKIPSQHLTLGQVVELNRRLLEGYTRFKDEPRVQKLRTDVLRYNRLLRDIGVRDHQVCEKNQSYMYFTEHIGYRFHERRKPVGKLLAF